MSVQGTYEQINRVCEADDEREAMYDELASVWLRKFLAAAKKADAEGMDAQTFMLALGTSDALENLLGTLFVSAKPSHRVVIAELYAVFNTLWKRKQVELK